MSKIVLGFSGGVDSTVSTMLLKKAGHEVYGLYMDNADEAARQCAIDTAEFIGVPLTVLDVKAELERNVCRPFTEAYLRGETPNPCIICNPSTKFKNLLAEADRVGAELVATGHYARTENGRLMKGMPANDQSYMLCRLSREQVRRTVFPLGGFEKKQVRALADGGCANALALAQQNAAYAVMVDEIRHSTSYRLGEWLTAVPRRCKRWLQKRLRRT